MEKYPLVSCKLSCGGSVAHSMRINSSYIFLQLLKWESVKGSMKNRKTNSKPDPKHMGYMTCVVYSNSKTIL